MDDLDLGQTLRGFRSEQKVFGRYTLKKILGRGGMGVVWLARDEELGADVALKFLPEIIMSDKGALDELRREARRSRELTHPHIVRIHDFIRDDSAAAISMEYVPGDTLANLRIEQPHRVFTVEQLTPWVVQLCSALDYAHIKAKVVHRDLKPANLMLDAEGDLKIADFGISASMADTATRISRQSSASGTALYMSPQQMMGDKPAPSDDLYSLGATLYELLTGKPPFYTGNVLMQVQQKTPPSMAARRTELEVQGEPIPDSWEQLVARCLAKDPADRPASAKGLASLLTDRPVTPISPPPPVAAPPSAPAPVVTVPPIIPPQAPETVAPLKPATGNLVLHIEPDRFTLDRAFITLNNARLQFGGNPAVAPVPVGCHSLRIEHPDFEVWEGEVTVQATVPNNEWITLVSKLVTVQFVSTPAGAQVRLTGEGLERALCLDNSGKEYLTPFSAELTLGSYRAHFSKEDCGPAEVEFTATMGELPTVEANLPAASSAVIKYIFIFVILIVGALLVLGISAMHTESSPSAVVAAVESQSNTPEALYKKGLAYYNGDGVAKDPVEAVKLFRIAAEKGLAPAQFYLGKAYYNGTGVAKDLAQAVAWYQKAADQADAKAQNNLGAAYNAGEGVAKDPVQAVAWFQKAAEQGLAIAQNNLGIAYVNGQGVTKDPVQAATWFKKAADQGYADAQGNLGLMYANGEGVATDPVQAVAWFRRAAEQGNADAQHNLGVMYANGEGVAKDPVQAVAWYRKAAEHGTAEAQNSLGLCYMSGQGVTKDSSEAVAWYHKAAEQNNTKAQNNLGYCYLTGDGVAKDLVQAAAWYSKAADQGDALAQMLLGFRYSNGEGVTKDLAQAVAWFRKAADQGLADAQNVLGGCYDNGDGIAKDPAQAVAWYQKAADQGFAAAQCNLGVMYQNGQGVAENLGQAVAWYQKAADQDFAAAQSSLGWMYANGQGVAKDPVQAVAWYRKAADKGFALAQCQLSFAYWNGAGVDKDDSQAAIWARKAADQNNAQGQYLTGWCYQFGRGVTKDMTEATRWYKLSADQGNEAAKKALGELAGPSPDLTKATTQVSEPKQQPAEIARRLNSIILPSVSFNEVDLSKVISTLMNLSIEYDQTSGPKGVNIILLDPANRNPLVSLSFKKGTSLKRMLEFILASAGYRYEISEDMVLVRPAK